MKRTYQPKNLRRIRKLGFRARNATKHGRNVLKRRMLKGRQRLTASREYHLLRKKPRARIR